MKKILALAASIVVFIVFSSANAHALDYEEMRELREEIAEGVVNVHTALILALQINDDLEETKAALANAEYEIEELKSIIGDENYRIGSLLYKGTVIDNMLHLRSSEEFNNRSFNDLRIRLDSLDTKNETYDYMMIAIIIALASLSILQFLLLFLFYNKFKRDSTHRAEWEK
ncbi:MAG: hypothetical protein LBS24_07400 [Clostridiales Family XIII bacterium]|jgi:hypothetical protein|nr:hypothetical protein [Clostridiales Family XIII bacterium]